MRKKLWLKIARHVVQEEKDVKKAMNCLSSCNLLKIEDILPFFPDFVTIDHFKVSEWNEDISFFASCSGWLVRVIRLPPLIL